MGAKVQIDGNTESPGDAVAQGEESVYSLQRS
jgi:hypothetical protein